MSYASSNSPDTTLLRLHLLGSILACPTAELWQGLQVLGMELQGALEIRYDVQPVKLRWRFVVQLSTLLYTTGRTCTALVIV